VIKGHVSPSVTSQLSPMIRFRVTDPKRAQMPPDSSPSRSHDYRWGSPMHPSLATLPTDKEGRLRTASAATCPTRTARKPCPDLPMPHERQMRRHRCSILPQTTSEKRTITRSTTGRWRTTTVYRDLVASLGESSYPSRPRSRTTCSGDRTIR
jgi:hypothetical protein